MNKRRMLSLAGLVFVAAPFAWAGETGGDSLTGRMTLLVLQLAIVIFSVRACGALAEIFKLPSVIGELLAGVIVGPYAFGALPLPGFPRGLFPLGDGFAISPELYAFSMVASVILLFSSGLETDIDMLIRYSVTGSIVGLGGVIASFGLGAGVGALLTGQSIFSPGSMFLGIMSTATSVGITARILSDRKKMDSPEGVTILAAAVFDDVLGIVLLAIVLGIVAVITGGAGRLSTLEITGIALKAFGIWLGFTAFGLIFGKRIAGILKKLGGETSYAVLALGLALLLAGFFEMQGLAMIIGAYIIGTSLSKSDIAYLVQDRTKPLYDFFVPVFFAIMGMLVDVRQILTPSVLAFGLVYTVAALAAKVVGCGLPSLFLGFNMKGAARIGIGMVPRGEVALIIAGIGLSQGILDPSVFGVAILMIMATSIIAPPLFDTAISRGGAGTRTPVKGADTDTIRLEFPDRALMELISVNFLRELQREGFYVQLMSIRDEISHIRKGDVSISLVVEGNCLLIETAPEDIPFVKATLHEIRMDLENNFDRLKESYDPAMLRSELHVEAGRKDKGFRRILDPRSVCASLKGETKGEVIGELVDLLEKTGVIRDRQQVLSDILEREKRMSTGMEHGIALPHARTNGILHQTIAIGIHKQGVDFGTIDGTPGQIIALIATPAGDEAPHMQVLASLGAVLGDEEVRRKLISAQDDKEVYRILHSV